MRLRVRPADPEEAEAIAELINAHARTLHGEADLSPRTVREWFANVDGVVRVAEIDDAELACYGDLAFSAARTRADLDVREHPSHPGSARAMLDELEAAAAAGGASTIRAYAVDTDTALAGVLGERGYRPIRHSYQMLVSLERALETPRWPDGIGVRTVAEGEERAVHAANDDAFSDHWSFEPQPYERWAKWSFESERFDRSLNFVAVEGDEIVGICLCSVHWSDDPTYGWVGILGVRPAWRRRGIALALLLHTFAEFRRRGCDRVGLGVDAQSTTGALELYGRAGMSVHRRMDTFEKAL
jgi:mycothiol synthase